MLCASRHHVWVCAHVRRLSPGPVWFLCDAHAPASGQVTLGPSTQLQLHIAPPCPACTREAQHTPAVLLWGPSSRAACTPACAAAGSCCMHGVSQLAQRLPYLQTPNADRTYGGPVQLCRCTSATWWAGWSQRRRCANYSTTPWPPRSPTRRALRSRWITICVHSLELPCIARHTPI
jgi:hypothetical protein